MFCQIMGISNLVGYNIIMVYHDKSSLGQNFIKYPSLVRQLVESSNINSSDTVLEIGPGHGIITKELVKIAHKVIAAEKDPTLSTKLIFPNFWFIFTNPTSRNMFVYIFPQS